jgi:hypothetical protein
LNVFRNEVLKNNLLTFVRRSRTSRRTISTLEVLILLLYVLLLPAVVDHLVPAREVGDAPPVEGLRGAERAQAAGVAFVVEVLVDLVDNSASEGLQMRRVLVMTRKQLLSSYSSSYSSSSSPSSSFFFTTTTTTTTAAIATGAIATIRLSLDPTDYVASFPAAAVVAVAVATFAAVAFSAVPFTNTAAA